MTPSSRSMPDPKKSIAPNSADSNKLEQQEEEEKTITWDSPNDPSNPFNWPVRKKWLVTLVPCYITLIVGLNATSITPAAAQINAQYTISDANFPNSFWAITAWNVGAAVAPMFALPLMEKYGMRPGYLMSYAVFAASVFPQAFAPGYATLVAVRAVAGCAGGVLQDVMDGVIADVWEGALERSLPVTVYVGALLVGVSLGPVVGGAVVGGGLHWRWIFYIQLILYGVSLPLVLLFKETRGPVILAHRNKSRQKVTHDKTFDHPTPSRDTGQSIKHFLSEALGRPTLLLFTEPIIFSFTLLSALSYGLLFLCTQSVTQVYGTLFSFTPARSGLVQTSLVVGELFGLLACLSQNSLFARRVHATPGRDETDVLEVRLYTAIAGSYVGLAGGLFFYAFTSYPFLHWTLPSVGLALIGFGSVTVMQAIMMYVTDGYASYAGSASAAVCFGENIFAGFLPLAAQGMYTELGFRWASALLGFVALALGAAPVVLVWKGRAVRGRSRFMLRDSLRRASA